MRYAVGLDFGTESGRAVLVDLATARSSRPRPRVRERRHRRRLPAPDDDVAPRARLGAAGPRRLHRDVPARRSRALLAETGVDPADVVGLGIDFTACTMLPTTADGTPLCTLADFRREPHAWVKLWKHHAAQPEADRINEVARRARRAVAAALRRPDLVGVVLLEEPPDPRRGAAGLPRRRPADRGRRLGRLAADRRRDAQQLHRRLQGDLVEGRTASRRPTTSPRSTRGSRRVVDDKMSRDDRADRRAGRRADARRRRRGPASGPAPPSRSPTSTPTSRCRPSTVTAPGHAWSRSWARAPATWCWATRPRPRRGHVRRRRGRDPPRPLRLRGRPVGRRRHLRLVRRARRPAGRTTSRPRPRRLDVHAVLEREAARLRPGENGLLALDWWNGNRSILVDVDLSGLLVGATLATRPRRTSTGRCIEATAFGTRVIIESLESAGVAGRRDRRLRRAAGAERAAHADLRRRHGTRVRRRGVARRRRPSGRRCTARSPRAPRPAATTRSRTRPRRWPGRASGRTDPDPRQREASTTTCSGVPGAARPLRPGRQRRHAAPPRPPRPPGPGRRPLPSADAAIAGTVRCRIRLRLRYRVKGATTCPRLLFPNS